MSTLQFDTDRMRYDLAVKGMTQTELAAKARVSEGSVTMFLKGDTRSPKMAKKLATALGFTVRRYLLTEQKAS